MAAHPYLPEGLSLPGYHPLVVRMETILAVFFGTFAVVVLLTWVLTGLTKRLSVGERMLACWFVVTGLIHLVVEGSFVANKDFYKDTSGWLLNDLWKEYSQADSRYATRDAFVVTMEGFTAFVEGPFCFVIVYAMLTAKPWRYVLMLLVSFGQWYGDVLYFLTSWHDGWAKDCRPEPYYFWFYFIFMNSIWIVVPMVAMWHAAARINAAVAAAGGAAPGSGKRAAGLKKRA